MKNQECHSTFAEIRAFFSHSRYCPTVNCQTCRATVLPLRHRRTILGNVASFSHFSACSCHVGIQPCSEFQALKAQESERLPSLARCPRNAKRIGAGAVPTDSLSLVQCSPTTVLGHHGRRENADLEASHGTVDLRRAESWTCTAQLAQLDLGEAVADSAHLQS